MTTRVTGARTRASRTVRSGLAALVLAPLLFSTARAAARPDDPLAAERLLIQGTRLSLAPGDDAQVLDVGESGTVRTCFAGICGSMAPGDPRVAGLAVRAELSGPELPEPVTYTAVPGGAFVLPGFQTEGTYLLSNVRLVRAGDGEVLGSATPSAAVLDVNRILVASASVRQLSLEELRARGIELTRESFNAYSFAVGFAFRGETVTIELPVLFEGSGQVDLLSKPEVRLDGLPEDVAAAVRRWQPPRLVPFRLDRDESAGLQPGEEREEAPPDAELFGVIVLPGNVSFLNKFFEAQLLVANGAPAGSGAVLANVTGAIRLPAADPRELLRLGRTSPPVAPGQKVPVLNVAGGSRIGPAEQGAASFTLEGLVPGTHVVTVEVGADLERPGRPSLPLAGRLKAAIEVVDARFNLAFNHPDVVREGEPYTLYVTVTNVSARFTENEVALKLEALRATGAVPQDSADDLVRRVGTLGPGEGRTVEYRLVPTVTGRCFATTFQSPDPLTAGIRLRAGVGEHGVPLSPSSLVLPRFTELLPEELVRANVRLLGLAYSLAVAPPGTIPPELPRLVRADVERRAFDLAEAGQRLFIGEDRLSSLEALLLDQLGDRHDLPEFDELRRTLSKGRDAAEALAALIREEQEARGLGAGALLEHAAATMGWSRPWLAATLESAGTGNAPTLELRKLNGVTGVTYLAYPAGDAKALRSLPYGEIYGVLDRPGGERAPLAVVGRLASTAGYAAVVHGPVTGPSRPVSLSLVAPDPDGAGFVRVDLPALAVPPGEAWAVEAVHASGDARPVSFALVHLATGVPVAGAPSPVVRSVPLPPFRLVGARQDFLLDPYGSGVWYLFNRPPAKADAEEEQRYEVRTDFRGLDTTASGAVLTRSTTFSALSAYVQPTSERVVAVRFAQPVSAIVAALGGEPVIAHEHWLDEAALRDAFGNGLSGPVPPIRIEEGHAGGLVEGKVVRGTGDPVAGAVVRLVRDRVVTTRDGLDSFVVHDLVAERTTDEEGAFFFPFVEEPVLSVPRPPEKGAVQSGFRIQAIVPRGPDPRMPEEKEEVSSLIRLQSRLARVSIALLGRGSLTGRVLYDDGGAVSRAAVTAASVLFSEVLSAEAGGDGAFRIDGLPVGPVTVTARDSDGRSAYATLAIDGPGATADVVLRLERSQTVRTGTVTGRVLLRRETAAGAISEPASGAQVAVWAGGAAWGSSTTGPSGSFRFLGVPAGRITVQAADFALSRTPALLDLDLAPDAATDVTLTLAVSTPRIVAGRVLYRDSLSQSDVPAAGVTVFVEGPGSFAVTDALGDYRIEGVPAQGESEGPYVLRAIDFARKVEGTTNVSVRGAGADPVLAATIVLSTSQKGSIDGVVLDPLGRPAAGVSVTLLPVGETLTRADGTFTFEGVPSRAYTVTAHRGTGLEPEAVGWIGEAPTEVLFGGHRPFVTVRLRGAGTVHVRTRTANAGVRSPVAYRPTWFSPQELVIRQKAASIETSTDDDGRLTLVVPTGELSVSATNPFHGTASYRGTIDFAGQVKEVDLLFSDAATVSGVVVDVDGVTPVEGINVTLEAAGLLPQTVKTRALGAFRFDLVPPGALSVTARGTQGAVEREGRTYGAVNRPGEALEVVVRLKPKGAVRGRVVDEITVGRFEPLSGAQLYLQENDFPWRRLPAAPGFLVADGDGRFEIADVSAGRFTIVARDPGQVARQGSRTGELRADFEVVDVGDVTLSGAVADLFVLVRDPEMGSPVSDAQVNLSNGEAMVTGADGRAAFAALPLGTWAVHAFHAPTGRGGQRGDIRLVVAGEALEVVVPLDRRGRVSGVLFDDEARSVPVGGGTVRLQGTVSGRLWGAGLTALSSTSREPGSLGAFLFDGLPVAPYTLTAGIDGSERQASESVALTATAPEASVALVLEPVREVWVRLYRKEQARGLVEVNPDPVRGDGVFSISYGRQRAPYSGALLPLETLLAPQVPSPGHRFGFRDVLARRSFWIDVSEAGGEGRRAFATSGELDAGGVGAGTETDPYRVVLRGRGTVRVLVRDAAGVPVPGATVRIHAGNGSWEASSDASGRVGFTAVEEGTVSVSAAVPGSPLGASASRTLQWDDEVLDVELKLAPVVGAHGVVYQAPVGDAWNGDPADLTPAAGVAVRIRPASGAEQLQITGADGTFRFAGLASGPYSLDARSLDGERVATSSGVLGAAHGTEYALAPLVLDASRPRIVSLTPPNGAVLVSRTAPVEVVFSEPLAPEILPSGPSSPFFQLTFGAAPATGSWSSALDDAGRQVVRFVPSPRYENSTTYTLQVVGGPSGVRDREGRLLSDSGDVGASFTTSDTDGPRVVGTLPSLARPVDPDVPVRVDFGEVLVLTPAQLERAVLFEWRSASGTWAAFPVTSSLTRGGYSILVAQPAGVAFAADSLRRRITVSGLTDASGNTMPAWIGEYRLRDANAPALSVALPAGAPDGDLLSSVSYTLTPAFGNLDDVTPENPWGDVDRVEYVFASAADPTQPASSPGAVRWAAPFALDFVAAYVGDGSSPRPFPVWVKAFDTSGNPSAQVRLDMRVLPNARPAVGEVSVAATAPVPGTPYAGSTLSATVGGIGDPDDARLTLAAELRRGVGAGAAVLEAVPARTLDRPAGGWGALTPQLFSFVVPVGEPEGQTLSVHVHATDGKGAVGSGEATLVVADDTAAPAVSGLVARRPDGTASTSFVLGDAFVLEVHAVDAQTAIRSVSLATTGGVLPAVLEADRVGTTDLFRTATLTVPSTLTAVVTIGVTASALDWGGNTSSTASEIEAGPSLDPTQPVAEWLSPFDGAVWPAAYTSVDPGKGGVDLLLRLRVTDRDRDGADQETPGSIVGVRVRGPVDAAGSLAPDWAPASRLSGTAADGTWEAVWRVPNGVVAGTLLPFEVEAVDAGANRVVRATMLRAVPARHVYESATTSVGPGADVPALPGSEALPVFLLDGTTLSLYPPEAGGPRPFGSLHLYSGGAWSSGPGSAIAVRRSILTVPEVTSYTSLVPYYPLELRIEESLGVAHGAAIDVSGRGLLGGDGSHDPVALPGERASAPGAGGSHGGMGHPKAEDWLARISEPGSSYDSIRDPGLPGSGGGAPGANGGGVVRIEAPDATLRIWGEIVADGGEPDATDASGGAGGAVRIRGKRVEGRGKVRAGGSTSAPGSFCSGGGGGRVSLTWREPEETALTVESPGAGSSLKGSGSEPFSPVAGAGTVFLERVDPAGVALDRGALFVVNPTTDAPAALTVLPGFGSARVVSVDAADRRLTIHAEGASGAISGELVHVVAPAIAGQGEVDLLLTVLEQRTGTGTTGATGQPLVLTVDAQEGELSAIGAALAANVPVSARARLRFERVGLRGAARAVVDGDLEVGGSLNRRETVAVEEPGRLVLSGDRPAVTFDGTWPSPGTSVAPNTTIEVRYSVHDPIGISRIEDYWAAAGTTVTRDLEEPLAVASSPQPIRITVPATSEAGPISYRVRATDRAGRTTESTVTWTVVGDISPPSITRISLSPSRPDDLYVAGDELFLSAEAVDETSVARIRIAVGDRFEVESSYTVGMDWIAPAVAETTVFTVTAIAYDAAGNSGTSSRSFRVAPRSNARPPTLAIDCPSAGLILPSGYTRFVISATASDDEGVYRVDFYREAEAMPFSSVESPDGSFRTFSASAPPISLPVVSQPAVMRFRARSMDYAGNVSSEAETTVTVVPAIPLSASGPNDWSALANEIAYLESGTLVLEEPHVLAGLLVLRDASITHPPGGAHSLVLTVNGPLSVECGGSLDATGKGLPAGSTYWGPVSEAHGRASHVGVGGGVSAASSSTYGSVCRPAEPGAGGSGPPTAGGGVIHLRAETVLLGGTTAAIRANGASSETWSGGAGGSVIVTATNLTGTGVIEAAGGAGGWSYYGGGREGGGGGAVAVDYESADADTLARVNARGGKAGSNSAAEEPNGGAGTVFLVGPGSRNGVLRVDNLGMAGNDTVLPPLGGGVAQVSTSGSRLVTDRTEPIAPYFVGRWIEVFRAGIRLGAWRVETVSAGTMTLQAEGSEPVELLPGDEWRGVYRLDRLEVAGAAVLRSDDPIHAEAVALKGPTQPIAFTEILTPILASSVTVDGRVAVSSVAATELTVKSGGTLSHPAIAVGTDPGLDLEIAGTLAIESGAAIDATGRGLPGVNGTANVPGSHFGLASAAASPYGSPTRPLEPGEGGRGWQPRPGGGVVRIRSGELLLAGATSAIRADGASETSGSYSASAGAGGSIWIKTGSIVGDGYVSARGGSGSYNGGGGAISLSYQSAAGTVLGRLLAFGAGYGSARSGAGTVLRRASGDPLGHLAVDNGGAAGAYPTALPALGSGLARPGSAGRTLVTDRSSAIPAYFVGHWVEIARNGVVLGMWRVGAVSDRTVALEPNGGESPTILEGDAWRGVYRFDSVSVSGGASLLSDDPIRDRIPTIHVLAPLAGSAYASGALVPVSFTTTDDRPVAQVTLEFAGVVTVIPGPDAATGTVRAPWLTSTATLPLVATVLDRAGQSVSTSVPITVLAAPPLSASITSPATGAALVGGTVETVRVVVPDARPIRTLTLALGSTSTTFRGLAGPSLSVSMSVPAVAADEARSLVATVEDEIGGTVSSAPVAVRLLADSSPRVVSSANVASPVDAGASVVVSFSGLFREPVGARVQLRVSGAVVHEATILSPYRPTGQAAVKALDVAAPWSASFPAFAVPTAARGPMTLEVTAVDGQGRTGSALPIVLEVVAPQNAPPGVSIQAPQSQDAVAVSGEILPVTVSIADDRSVAELEIALGGGRLRVQNPSLGSQAFGVPVPSVSEDVLVDLSARVTDDLGLTGTAGPLAVSVVTDALPRVRASVEPEGPYEPGASLSFAFEALAARGGETASLEIAGAFLHEETVTVPDGRKRFTGGFAPVLVPSDAHGEATAVVRVKDLDGQVTASAELSLRIGGDRPPRGTLSSPPTAEAGGELAVVLEASDDFGLRSARLLIAGAFEASRLVTLGPVEGGTLSFSRVLRVPVPPEAFGEVTISVELTDVADQRSAVAPSTVSVADSAPPVVTRLRSPQEFWRSGEHVSFWADVRDAGRIVEVRFSVDGVPFASSSDPLFRNTYEVMAYELPTSAEPRTVSIRVEAEDAAGNVGTATRDFTVLPTGAPAIRFNSPSDGAMAVPGGSFLLTVHVEHPRELARIAFFRQGETAPIAEMPGSDRFAEWTVPPDAAPGSVLALRVEATDDLGAVGTATATIRIVEGTVLGPGTWIGSGDTAYDDRAIVVAGDVQVRGNHRFSQLVIARHGVIRFGEEGEAEPGNSKIEVTGDAYVAFDGSIDASGRGYAGGLQGSNPLPAGLTAAGLPGSTSGAGGSNGGAGEPASGGVAGPVYGSLRRPSLPGSGGGADEVLGSGGSGGGLIRLSVGGRLVLDGELNAMGRDGEGGGSGAGGSVWIEAESFGGAGVIFATGGSPTPRAGLGGSAGGGRIAIHAALEERVPHLTVASGPHSFSFGSPGTVFVRSTGDRYGHLLVDTGWCEQARPTPLVSLGSGAVAEAAGRSFRGSGTTWVPGLEGKQVDVWRGENFVGRFEIAAVDTEAQTVLLEEDADGQVEPGDIYTGIEPLDSVTLTGRSRLVSADTLLGRFVLDRSAGVEAPNVGLPPADAAPEVAASVPTRSVTAGQALPVTVRSRDDVGLRDAVLWIEGLDGSRVEVPIAGNPASDERVVSFPVPSDVPPGERFLVVGVHDSELQWSSTTIRLEVSAATGSRVATRVSPALAAGARKVTRAPRLPASPDSRHAAPPAPSPTAPSSQRPYAIRIR